MTQINAALREAEKSIVASILGGKLTASDTALKGTEFQTPDYRDIFMVCLEIESGGGEVDFITVSNNLGIGQPSHYIPPTPRSLVNLTTAASTFDLNACLSFVRAESSKQILKDLFETCAKNLNSSEMQPLETIEYAEKQFNSIRVALGTSPNVRHVSELVPLMETIYSELKSGISHSIPTGITEIDNATGGGGAPGDVWIIGSFTGMGKSSLALQLARNQSARGVGSLVISREMLDIENFKRLHSSISNVPLWRVKPNMHEGTYNKLVGSLGQVAEQKIWIDSTSADMPSIARSIRETVKAFGVRVIYIDYLQLLSGIKGSKMSRADEVAYCSRTLKELAMQTETLIISLAQYNRLAAYNGQAENHSFAESSAIEKDASIVLHLELEKIELKPGEKPPVWRKALIRIGKARSSPQATVNLWFRGETFTFTSDEHYPIDSDTGESTVQSEIVENYYEIN